MRHRHALTDAQWERIKGHLPGKQGDSGRIASDNRLFVGAVLYMLKTGAPWAALPGPFGKPNTVWKRYDRSCRSGAWERIGNGSLRL
ncbi:MAG: transposase [Isosphaeraceae bacterium]